jgi:hypothetical protein
VTVEGGAKELGDNGQIYIDIHNGGGFANDWVSRLQKLNSRYALCGIECALYGVEHTSLYVVSSILCMV